MLLRVSDGHGAKGSQDGFINKTAIRCCIIVPTKAKMMKPAVSSCALELFTHCPALRPSTIKTANAAMCIQRYGTVPQGVLMKFNVKGSRAYPTSKSAFSATTGNHFPFTKNPKDTATTNAGRKSSPKKGAGEPMPMAAKVPMSLLIPPM
jgi:hypothetical protein